MEALWKAGASDFEVARFFSDFPRTSHHLGLFLLSNHTSLDLTQLRKILRRENEDTAKDNEMKMSS